MGHLVLKKDKAYSYLHLLGRLFERHGLGLEIADFERLNAAAAKAKTYRQERNGADTQRILKLNYKGKLLTFVYSEQRGCVTTVFPKKEIKRCR